MQILGRDVTPMPQKARYDELSEHNPSTLVLQLQGGFYHAYDDSARVLANITGYKLRQKPTGRLECGFPANVLEKIIDVLKRDGIRYIVFKGEAVIKENPCDGKRYKEVLENLPPPVISPANRPKDSPPKNEPGKESQNLPDLVEVDFKCPRKLYGKLEELKQSDKFWDKSFDAVIVKLLTDGMKGLSP